MLGGKWNENSGSELGRKEGRELGMDGGDHKEARGEPLRGNPPANLGPPPPDDQMHDVDGELSLFIAIKPFSRLFVLVSLCLLPPPLSCRTEPKVPRENFPAVHPSNSEGANGANISSTLTEHLPPAARSPFLALARRSLPPSLRLTEKENSRGKGLSPPLPALPSFLSSRRRRMNHYRKRPPHPPSVTCPLLSRRGSKGPNELRPGTYWVRLKGSYVVARIFFLLLLNCSAWPCLGSA